MFIAAQSTFATYNMSEPQLPWLHVNQLDFPDVESAWDEPNGILAVGGDLSVARLVKAYCLGIFPWYNENEPILWWSPNPRCVLKPAEVRITKSLKKTINKQKFTISFNQAFEDVVDNCAAPRKVLNDDEVGTWISDEMKQAYLRLHQEGYAHSVEAWLEGELVGGLYGLAIGKVFFGESMFSKVTDASKVAFVTLCKTLEYNEFKLIDGQVYSPHLETLGFKLIPRTEFTQQLSTLTSPSEKTSFNLK